MKKIMLALAALTLTAGTSLAWAADEPSAAQPSSQPSAMQPSNAPSMGNSPAAQTPPQDWKELSGTVQAVDQTAKTLQIKDETGNLVQVPLDRHVTIKKNGEKVKLSQVQVGDTITLAKRSMSASENEKSMAY